MLSSVISQTVDVRLSIELESEPITGVMATGIGQPPRRFSGWVELAGAIEDVRLRRPGGAGAGTSGRGPGAKAEGAQ
jgi:hypothetical protein